MKFKHYMYIIIAATLLYVGYGTFKAGKRVVESVQPTVYGK